MFQPEGFHQLKETKYMTIYNNKRKHDICRTLYYRVQLSRWTESSCVYTIERSRYDFYSNYMYMYMLYVREL